MPIAKIAAKQSHLCDQSLVRRVANSVGLPSGEDVGGATVEITIHINARLGARLAAAGLVASLQSLIQRADELHEVIFCRPCPDSACSKTSAALTEGRHICRNLNLSNIDPLYQPRKLPRSVQYHASSASDEFARRLARKRPHCLAFLNEEEPL